MRSATIGFVIGVVLLQQQAALWSYNLLILITLAMFPLMALIPVLTRYALLIQKSQARHVVDLVYLLRHVYLLGIGIVFGFCWAGIVAYQVLRQELPKNLENQDALIVGVIDSLPDFHSNGQSFLLRVEKLISPNWADQASYSDKQFPERIALAWYSEAQSPRQTVALKPGQRWQLAVRLKRVHGNANPYGFDYEALMFEQGVRATGVVRANSAETAQSTRKLDEFVPSLHRWIQLGRFYLREKIQGALPNARYAGVVTALVIGDQRNISANDWTLFNRTGIGHLISISGLHITMIAGLFAGLAHFFWRHSFFTQWQLPLLLPAPKVAVLVAWITALIYVALAGFGIPAQRTLWMITILAFAVWTGRDSNPTQVLSLALLAVLLVDPWAICWPGFWLSFCAVALLMYVNVGRFEIAHAEPTETAQLLPYASPEALASSSHQMAQIERGKLGQWREIWTRCLGQLRLAARAQYAITVGLVPLSLLLFAQISLVAPIANALAIPFISFIVTPLALAGSVLFSPLSEWVLGFALVGVESLVQILSILGSSRLAVWQIPVPSWWMFLLAVVGTLWILAPRGIPFRAVGWIFYAPLLLNPVSKPQQGEMSVTAFDVGQGSAVLIETAEHRVLYDTGPGLQIDSNSGTRILLPYFQARGIGSLDKLIISHADNDHSGGALSILNGIEVNTLSSSLPSDHPIVEAAKHAESCVAGQSWDWDGVHFEILHPVPVIYTSPKWKTNALSCTLKVSTKSKSLLLAGDIEAIQEDELVNSIPDKLRSTVLLAPHHGSGTSSSSGFLQSVRPEWAIFQVGYLNRYHHPKHDILQRYHDFGIKPLRTDISGAITLQFGDTLSVSQYREKRARYWYP
ncbi:DNA internalization-related competence protein ComEC/Rec2 [Undibacterium fentianense]|uniref:DNA internalization-related competence protein ComEC/Rec2 n=1 Tax=Undibacterium fentianense TaxID=2828728 RepID=A0A941E3I3_9BURK|nr:DNA internalization-related competence protein ComEC/Rec2 [Undibacterium fentianense]MBR7799048.1 DNA internalization-related competence protein ComEC/Rec2 [Undibacterium fentianense]